MVYACFFVLLMMLIIVDPVDAQDHPQIDAPEFVKLINWRRRQFAKTFRFPNVYEVKWDEKLVELAKRPFDGSKNQMKGDNFRGYKLRHGFLKGSFMLKDAITVFHLNTKQSNTKLETLLNMDVVGSIEFLVPGQTKIGCAPKQLNDEAYVLCLLGPEASLDSLRVKRGNDGTMCQEGHNNIDGLCQWRDEVHEYGDSAVAGSEKLNFLPLMVLQCMMMIFFFLYI